MKKIFDHRKTSAKLVPAMDSTTKIQIAASLVEYDEERKILIHKQTRKNVTYYNKKTRNWFLRLKIGDDYITLLAHRVLYYMTHNRIPEFVYYIDKDAHLVPDNLTENKDLRDKRKNSSPPSKFAKLYFNKKDQATLTDALTEAGIPFSLNHKQYKTELTNPCLVDETDIDELNKPSDITPNPVETNPMIPSWRNPLHKLYKQPQAPEWTNPNS